MKKIREFPYKNFFKLLINARPGFGLYLLGFILFIVGGWKALLVYSTLLLLNIVLLILYCPPLKSQLFEKK